MQKKYFFFDIDGTLTNRQTKETVPSAITAIKKLQDAGHFVAIATGRAQYKAIDFIHSLNVYNMVCAGGGCIVLDDKVIENNPLPFDRCIEIADQATQLGYGILFALDDSIDVYSSNDLFIQQCGRRKEPTNYIIDSSFDHHKVKEIYKMYISIPLEKEELLTKKELVGHLRFEKEYLMFQHDEKKAGIIKMLKYINGDVKDVVVFGDDTNDLNMFDPSWTSIAMGNACDELKAHASYITDTNINDGIDKACKHFGWYELVEKKDEN